MEYNKKISKRTRPGMKKGLKPWLQHATVQLHDWVSRSAGRQASPVGKRTQKMQSWHKVTWRVLLLADIPQSDRGRLLRSGGISLFLHLILISFMVAYLMAGNPNGGGDGNGGGSSVYRVTILPFSSQNRARTPLVRAQTPTRTVFAKTSLTRERQTASIPPASTVELTAQDQSATAAGDAVGRQGTGGEGQGDGTGTGDGTGPGWNIFGWKGFGRSGASAPRYLENPKPPYPLEARQQGYQGKVMLKVEVLQTGRVGEVRVARSSGYEILDRSALTTVKKWRFIPAKREQIPILSWVNILVTFQLRDSGF
jgi:TonB family protein